MHVVNNGTVRSSLGSLVLVNGGPRAGAGYSNPSAHDMSARR